MVTELFQRKKPLILAEDGKRKPLISIVIISYNNGHFLYHAVKSVLSQSYENIELIISDDASVGWTIEDSARLVCSAIGDLIFEYNYIHSDGVFRGWKKSKFSNEQQLKKHREELAEWERENLGNYQHAAMELVKELFSNIRKLEFRCNSDNFGTVKHLKLLKRNTTGKYILFLAADDKLHDNDVVKDLIDYFERLPDNAYVLSSQCGMCDENLDQLYYYAVNENLKEIIKTSTPQELFAALTDWCIIPAAGTIYKKEVFDIFGDLDERYRLVEDWTYFLKLTRSGGEIYYYDRLTYMHRDGGISHGNNTGGDIAYKYYLEDCILLTQQEILPYLDQITSKQKKQSLKRYRNTCREYKRKFQFSSMSFLQKLTFIIKYGDHYIPQLIYRALTYFKQRAQWCFLLGVVTLIFSFLISLTPLPDVNSTLLYKGLGLLGMILIPISIFSEFLYHLVQTIRK